VICRPEEGGNHPQENEHEDTGRQYGDQQELGCVPHGFRLDPPTAQDRGACGNARASRCRQSLESSVHERIHWLPRLTARRAP
jgi:hypothetical protein